MTSTITAGHKGQAKQGGAKSLGRKPRGRRTKREPGRGHYDKDRPAIIAWVSRQGAVVVHATKEFTVKTVQKAANLAVQAGGRLYTDSASSYRALTGYVHEFVNNRRSSPVSQCQDLQTWRHTAGGVVQTREGTGLLQCEGCRVRKPEAERYRPQSAFTVCSQPC